MNRNELVAILKKVEAALSSNDLIAVLACFCCGQNSTAAYDDTIALHFPASTGIRGAVRGKLLLDFLNLSRAKELSLEQKESTLTVKAGRAKLETSVLPEDDFIFRPPKMDKATEVVVSEVMMECLKRASISMNHDPSQPWMLGITMRNGDAGTSFYSSNNKTVSRVVLGDPESAGKSVILPPKFVDLLLGTAKKDQPQSLYFTKDWVQARFASGLKLFSKSVPDVNVKNYADLFSGIDGRKEKAVEIPPGLDRCLERAMTVTPFSKKPFTSLKASGDRLRLRTESPIGEVSDSLPFTWPKEVGVRIPPEIARPGLVAAKQISLWPDAVRLSAKGYDFLVATVSDDEQQDEQQKDE